MTTVKHRWNYKRIHSFLLSLKKMIEDAKPRHKLYDFKGLHKGTCFSNEYLLKAGDKIKVDNETRKIIAVNGNTITVEKPW